MDRREVFGVFGSVGAGLVLGGGSGAAAADGHAGGAGGNPLSGPHAHFCGIHVAKHDPKFQLVVQHYCAAHSPDGHGDDMFQCVLFDGTGKNAKLIGVEYIISDKRYRGLPEAEKRYWHPHTYEVLAGGLIAPGMPAEEEKKFMAAVLTTWGKTWHTWPDPRTPVPVGEPMLIWSLMADGQADAKVVADRDRRFGVSTAEVRARRGRELGLQVPRVSFPKSMDQAGRQWTDSGDDRPTRTQ